MLFRNFDENGKNSIFGELWYFQYMRWLIEAGEFSLQWKKDHPLFLKINSRCEKKVQNVSNKHVASGIWQPWRWSICQKKAL